MRSCGHPLFHRRRHRAQVAKECDAFVIDLEIEFVESHEGEHQFTLIDALPAEHAPNMNGAEVAEDIAKGLGGFEFLCCIS